MKAYACCPICAYKLCKGESGSVVDIQCPRCKKIITVIISETNVKCTPSELQKKETVFKI